MTHSPLTNQIRLSSQNDSRNGRKIDRFIVHHAASTNLDGVVDMMVRATREVSANYVVGDRIVCVVDEDRRAWTSASADWDGRAITVETINNNTDRWTVSDKTFDNLARLIADCSKRYGFPINNDTVITHQELYNRYGASYATSCPGDLQRRKGELINLANKYRGGSAGTQAPAQAPSSTDATPKQWLTIQDWLSRLGRYSGPVDGKPGVNTWKGVQTTVKKYGYYDGPVDGVPGANTFKGMQKYAANGGGYTGPIDGVMGPNSWNGFIRRLAS